MSIRENRIISIDNRIFSLSNLKELADIVYEEYQIANKADPYTQIIFSAKCFEPSSFESEAPSLFNQDSILNKKRVKSVVMDFYSSKTKKIQIRLNHGSYTLDDKIVSDSDIEIGGNDSFWVSGVADRLITVIESFPKQNSWLLKNKTKITWLVFILSSYATGHAFDLIEKNSSNFVHYWSKAFSSDETFGYFILPVLIGVTFSLYVHNFIKSNGYELWPIVELQVGPEHSFVEKKRRSFAYLAITLFVIPILLSIVSTMITP